MVGLSLNGDFDFQQLGIASRSRWLEYEETLENVTFSFAKNNFNGMPVWAQRILRHELPKLACCVGCGKAPDESLHPCDCREETIRLPIEAWRKVERRIHNYGDSTRKKAWRRWAEGHLAGYFTDADLKKIFKIQNGDCYFCSDPLKRHGPGRWQIDHLAPIGRFHSTNWPSNIALVCPRCNGRAGNELKSALWRRLKKEKGAKFVKQRRSIVREFDRAKRSMDVVREAAVERACKSMGKSLFEELQAEGRGGVRCEIEYQPAGVMVTVGLIVFTLPASFHARVVTWSNRQCRDFCQQLIGIAKTSGALMFGGSFELRY